MLYCKKCKILYDIKIDKCKICKQKLTCDVKDNDIVLLARTNKENVKSIEEILSLNSIDFIEQIDKMDFSNFNDYFNIYVSYADLARCKKLLSNLEDKDYQNIDTIDEMSPFKRNIVRFACALFFILAVCFIVFLIDYLADFIKGVI